MYTPALFFELFTITSLLVLGITLLSLALPGWGLIIIAGLLSMLSMSLRFIKPEAHLEPATEV